MKIYFICFFSLGMMGQKGYPEPKKTPTRLFYIQHSFNHNTYVYDANLVGGNFDYKNPIEEYRYVYTEGGIKKPLSPIQKKMAYGAQVQHIKGNFYKFTLAASQDMVFYLKLTSDGSPKVFVTANGRKMYLDRMYLELEDKITSLSVKADYFLFEGTDYLTGEKVVEKVFP